MMMPITTCRAASSSTPTTLQFPAPIKRRTAIALYSALLGLAVVVIAALSSTCLAQETRTNTSASVASVEPGTAKFTLASPLDYQVFQRRTRLQGTIHVRGTVRWCRTAATTSPGTAAASASGKVLRVVARVTGTSLAGKLPSIWRQATVDKSTGWFYADLPTYAGGFYQVEVMLIQAGQAPVQLSVPHVGVGEVFVVSGQSNSTNYGEVRQHTETGMVTSFSGTTWALANDPQPGVQDNSSKGSFIPAFGDALYRKYHVPIGIASVGHGSTSVRQWLPAGEPVLKMPTMTRFVARRQDGTLVSDGTLFTGMMLRIDQLGVRGFRALLWHQGESDADQPAEHQITAQQYGQMLTHVIQSARKQAGWDFPWFVAQVSYHTPEDQGSPSLRQAQRQLWLSGIALQGPDTDSLTAAYRQNNGKGTHLNDAGLKAHGLLWANAVQTYLNKTLP